MELPILVSNTTVASATLNSNYTGSAQDVSEVRILSIHHVWTGTPAGNIIVEASNTGSDYVAVDTQAAGGAAGSKLVTISDVSYKYIRVRYAFSSSTGVLTSTICSKR